MREWWKYDAPWFLGTLVVILALALALAWFGVSLQAYGCAVRGDMMGVSHVYHWTTGCMVQIDGQWLPLDNYRVLDDNN